MTSESTDIVDVELEEHIYRSRYDFDEMAPGTAVVDLLQTVTDTDGTDLKPLHGVIDLDALNDLVGGAMTENRRSYCTVSFPYQGLVVTVRSDGTISIRPDSESDRTDDREQC